MNDLIQVGPGFYRVFVVESFKLGLMTAHEAARLLFNAGFRGSALVPR